MLSIYNENDVEQIIRAGMPLPANVAPFPVASGIATGNGLNAGGFVSPWAVHAPPANYESFRLMLFADVPKRLVPRFVIPYWEMNFSHTNAGSHRIAVFYGVYSTELSNWVSPIYTVCRFFRNQTFPGHSFGDWYITGATAGTNNGQYLPSSAFNQFPVEVHPSVMELAKQNEDYALRFFMVLNNTHASENITGAWRAWFMLRCF